MLIRNGKGVQSNENRLDTLTLYILKSFEKQLWIPT